MGTKQIAVASAFLLGLTALAGVALAQNQTPPCVEVEGVSRWGAAAFNHWVIVENNCENAVRCTVRTDVSPDSQDLAVPAGARREVLTFRGSPARTFTPRVSCDEQ